MSFEAQEAAILAANILADHIRSCRACKTDEACDRLNALRVQHPFCDAAYGIEDIPPTISDGAPMRPTSGPLAIRKADIDLDKKQIRVGEVETGAPDEAMMVVCFRRIGPPSFPSLRTSCHNCKSPVWISAGTAASAVANAPYVVRCVSCIASGPERTS